MGADEGVGPAGIGKAMILGEGDQWSARVSNSGGVGASDGSDGAESDELMRVESLEVFGGRLDGLLPRAR